MSAVLIDERRPRGAAKVKPVTAAAPVAVARPAALAFGGAIVAQLPVIERYARKLTRGDREATRDLVQEVVAHVLAREGRYVERGKLAQWLVTVVHNVWVNGCRARWRDRSLTASFSGSVFDPATNEWREIATPRSAATEPNQDATLIIDDIERCLAALPPSQSVVVRMVAVDDLSYEDVAHALGVPVGTVRSRLARGRALLREMLGDEGARSTFGRRCRNRMAPRGSDQAINKG